MWEWIGLALYVAGSVGIVAGLVWFDRWMTRHERAHLKRLEEEEAREPAQKYDRFREPAAGDEKVPF